MFLRTTTRKLIVLIYVQFSVHSPQSTDKTRCFHHFSCEGAMRVSSELIKSLLLVLVVVVFGELSNTLLLQVRNVYFDF